MVLHVSIGREFPPPPRRHAVGESRDPEPQAQLTHYSAGRPETHDFLWPRSPPLPEGKDNTMALQRLAVGLKCSNTGRVPGTYEPLSKQYLFLLSLSYLYTLLFFLNRLGRWGKV